MSKKSIFTTLFTFFLCAFFSMSAQANTMISINEKNFPDDMFRKYLTRYDVDNDGFFNSSELDSVTELNILRQRIFNLEGLQFFHNLKLLDCSENSIKEIDVSQNTKLEGLYCYATGISELDLSNNPELKVLKSPETSLISIDLSHNPKLTDIDLSYNTRVFNTKQVDTKKLPNFDLSRTSQWTNADIKGTLITFKDESKMISYTYNLGNGATAEFSWMYRADYNPTPQQPQKITVQSSYVKTFGDSSFIINAKTNGDGMIAYTTNDTNIIKVNAQSGKVDILNAGKATINIAASTTETYLPAWKTVEITILPKKISLDTLPSSYVFTYGDTTTNLKPRAYASNTPLLSYKSNNERVVKVDQSGNVQVIGAGNTTIQVTLESSDKNYESVSKTIQVIVRPKPLYISGIKSSYSTTYGKNLSMKPISEGKISYTVKDTKVATINNGKITTKGPGKTTIVVTSSLNSNYTPTTKTVAVVVKPKTLSKPKTSVSGKKLKVSWKKDSKVNGYELLYATNSKFTKGKKVTTLKKSSYTKKTLSMKKKGTYYVKIRSYKLVGKEKIYSSFSKTAKVRIR